MLEKLRALYVRCFLIIVIGLMCSLFVDVVSVIVRIAFGPIGCWSTCSGIGRRCGLRMWFIKIGMRKFLVVATLCPVGSHMNVSIRIFAQCRLVGTHYQGWRCPGALCSNVVCRRLQLFEKRCDRTGGTAKFEELLWNYLNRKAEKPEIATGLSWIVMHVLRDTPPPVPPRGEPMVFVLTSRKRKPKWERAQHEGIVRRCEERMNRRYYKERERRRRADDSDSEESSEEEGIA